MTEPKFFRPMLFLEGPDGAGKSSLVSPLRRALQHRVHVWDRWYGSMWVYEPLHGADPSAYEYTRAASTWISFVLGSVAQVVLLPSVEDLVARTSREQLPMQPRQQLERFRAWADASARDGIPTLVDDGSGSPEEIAERVARWYASAVLQERNGDR